MLLQKNIKFEKNINRTERPRESKINFFIEIMIVEGNFNSHLLKTFHRKTTNNFRYNSMVNGYVKINISLQCRSL